MAPRRGVPDLVNVSKSDVAFDGVSRVRRLRNADPASWDCPRAESGEDNDRGGVAPSVQSSFFTFG